MDKCAARAIKRKEIQMSVVVLVILLVAIAIGATLIRRSSMAEPFKGGLFWTLVIIFFVLILYAFGIWDVIRGARVPRV